MYNGLTLNGRHCINVLITKLSSERKAAELGGNMKKVSAIIETVLIVLLVVATVGIWMTASKNKAGNEEAAMLNEAKVVLYEGPKTLRDATAEDLEPANEESKDFSLLHCTDTTVTVNGQDCYVYDTNVNNSRAWSNSYLPLISRTPITYFSFEGAVKIQVTVPDRALDSVKISPVAYGIEPEIDKENHTVTFTVTEPDTYTLTFDESPSRALHIFAYPLEEEEVDPEDESIIYIGSGEWNIENIMLKDGDTLYVSGGAVVHGIINANYAKDITVKGRGIIDGSHLAGWKGTSASIPLKFDHCENVEISDIIVLNANAWVCQAFDSKNGVIDGIKIVSPRPNGDGITLQSCQNYEVKNCFVRSWDDSLVVKNYDGSSTDISFENMQLWTDLAQSMEVGYETNKGAIENAEMSNITFKDITVLNNYHKPVISVHNADDAIVHDILFENVTVENEEIGSGDGDEMPYLIDINIAQSSNWSTTKERGQIQNVTIRNVNVLNGRDVESRIEGYDEEHIVDGVTIENLTILGKKITSFEEGRFLIDEDTTSNLNISFTE